MGSPHLRMSAHLIGMGQLDLTIQPSRAQERRVQGIGPGETLRAGEADGNIVGTPW